MSCLHYDSFIHYFFLPHLLSLQKFVLDFHDYLRLPKRTFKKKKFTQYCRFVHLSAGDLLREERQNPESDVGEMIETYIRVKLCFPFFSFMIY